MNCTDIPNDSYVGPQQVSCHCLKSGSNNIYLQVFASIGHWVTSVYIILALHAAPVLVFSAHIRLRSTSSAPPHLSSLVSCPPLLMILASLGIIIPSSGIFVEVSMWQASALHYCSFFWECAVACHEHKLFLRRLRCKNISENIKINSSIFQVMLEIVIVVSMLKYIQFILARLDGSDQLVEKCSQENVRLALGE